MSDIKAGYRVIVRRGLKAREGAGAKRRPSRWGWLGVCFSAAIFGIALHLAVGMRLADKRRLEKLAEEQKAQWQVYFDKAGGVTNYIIPFALPATTNSPIRKPRLPEYRKGCWLI